ncbi:MAG TPA: hypothetical protein VFI84_04395 [Candidatus Saccharimonadales bacterium]|nr:hypothetical protein [Candidatus Saccharimonadales bacterium]
MRRPRTRKFRLIIRRAIASAAVLPLLMFPTMAGALSAGGDKTVNCDDNAVLYCGALSSDNLIHKYDNGDGKNSAQSIHDIYSYTKFGITSTEVHAIGSTAVAGTVTKTGNVIVGGKVVATNAMTAGRQQLSGGTKTSSGGTTFYVRSPSVSFTQDTLDAYVVMKNGAFQFAILSSCGNPVAATPVKPKTTTPPPAQQPQPQPPVCTNFDIAPTGDTRTIKVTAFSYNANGAMFKSATIDWGDQAKATLNDTNQVVWQTHQYAQDTTYQVGVVITFSQNGQDVQTAPVAACEKKVEFKPAAQPQVVTVAFTQPAPPAALPNTGPGTVAEVFVAVSAAGTIGYYWFARRRLN